MKYIKKKHTSVPPPAEKEKEQIKPAGFNVRVYASMLDFIILTILLMPFFGVGGGEIPERLQQAYQEHAAGLISDRDLAKLQVQESLARIPAGVMSLLVIMGLYLIPFWHYKSASIGKILFGIKIISAKDYEEGYINRKKLPLGLCFKRYLVYLASAVPFLMGFFAVAFNKQKRGFHDSIAGTYVVHKKTSFFNISQKNFEKIKIIGAVVVLLFIFAYINYASRN